MIIHEAAGLTYYQFITLENKAIFQAIITRHGGVSIPPWDSLNIGNSVGDNPKHVSENKLKILETFGFSENQIVQIVTVESFAWQIESF